MNIADLPRLSQSKQHGRSKTKRGCSKSLRNNRRSPALEKSHEHSWTRIPNSVKTHWTSNFFVVPSRLVPGYLKIFQLSEFTNLRTQGSRGLYGILGTFLHVAWRFSLCPRSCLHTPSNLYRNDVDSIIPQQEVDGRLSSNMTNLRISLVPRPWVHFASSSFRSRFWRPFSRRPGTSFRSICTSEFSEPNMWNTWNHKSVLFQLEQHKISCPLWN